MAKTGADGKRLHVPERFTNDFEDLVAHINYMPPLVPITITWNKHLPHFDSTREDQEYKVFADLPSDLPFNYGSLTALRTSFWPLIGSTNMPAFAVPGLQFFAIRGNTNTTRNGEIRQEHGSVRSYWLPTHASPEGNSKQIH